MVVVMRTGAAPEQTDAVVARVESAGGSAFVSRGVQRTIVGLVGDIAAFQSLYRLAMPGGGDVVRRPKPRTLVRRASPPEATTIPVGGVPIGPDTFTLIAGPRACDPADRSLES